VLNFSSEDMKKEASMTLSKVLKILYFLGTRPINQSVE